MSRQCLLRRPCQRRPGPHPPAHLISSAEKLTMVGMKFSLMMMERICFQSVVLSPSSRQMDSSASFTAAGGLAMDRTSTRCCFLMDFTAGAQGRGHTVRGDQTTATLRLPPETGVCAGDLSERGVSYLKTLWNSCSGQNNYQDLTVPSPDRNILENGQLSVKMLQKS